MISPGEFGSGCLGALARFLVDMVSPGGHPLLPGERSEGGSLTWRFLHGTGSILICLLTFGRVWLSDRHEFLAGVIGIAVYVALLWWAIPFFVAYADRPRSS